MPTSVTEMSSDRHILKLPIFFNFTLDSNFRHAKEHSRMSVHESYAQFDLFKYIFISFSHVWNFVRHFCGLLSGERLYVYL